MPLIDSTATALHGITLQAGTETVVTFAGSPRAVEVVVTTPGSDPIYWNAAGESATVAGADCRVIPAGALAVDSATPRRLTDPDAGTYRATVRLISASAATVSVQRG